MEANNAFGISTIHDGSRQCDCKRCVRLDPARFAGNRRGDPVQLRFQARHGYTVHLSSESCGGYAFCGADVGHRLGAGTYDIRAIKICKKCVSPDALAIAYGLISFVAWARSTWSGVDVDVARAGLASARKHGIVNQRYGCYRHDGERGYQWGNFTGVGPSVHVVWAVEPTDENTASTETLIAALRVAGGE